MKKLFLFLTAAGLVSLSSCSSDDDNGGNNNPDPTPTSITLAASATNVTVGQNVTFTVTTDLGTNVTADAVITVSGTELDGATFTATQAGTFTATATFGTLTSGEVTITVTEEQVVEPSDNAIVYNGQSYDVTKTAYIFWGGIDLDEDGTADGAYWSVVTFTGDDFNDFETSANYSEIDFYTLLDEGQLVLPGVDNCEFMEIWELRIAGSEVEISSEESASIVVNGLDTENATTNYLINASFNQGSTLEIDFDGAAVIYDASGRPGARTSSNLPVLSKNDVKSLKSQFFGR